MGVHRILWIFLCILAFLSLSGCLPPSDGGTADDAPPVLSLPVSGEGGTRQVFINTYYGQPGCSVPSPENSYGMHYSLDFKVSLPVAAPGEAPVYASCPGTVTDIIIRETTPQGYVYANVLVRYNRRYTMDYNFEPASRIAIAKGQRVAIGDVVGYLGPCSDDPGHGALDWGLGDNVEKLRKCTVPFLTSAAKTKLEEWYKVKDWSSAGKPYPEGPCVCHYPMIDPSPPT